MFLQCFYEYNFLNFTAQPDNHAKHHHTSYSKVKAAFSALRRSRTTSNQPYPVTIAQVKLWLIAEMTIISLFFCSNDVSSGKFHSVYFVLFINVRCRRRKSTVQIYFIKFSGKNVPWYLNAKVRIRSIRDGGRCRKSIIFWFITNPCLPLQ